MNDDLMPQGLESLYSFLRSTKHKSAKELFIDLVKIPFVTICTIVLILKLRRQNDAGSEPAHGLDCLVELLGFEISLIKSGGEGVHNDLNVFGLDLLAATLTAGKSAFAQHDMMMSLIREDLFQAVLHLAKTSNLACLSGVCQVALQLYVHLGKQLLLQLEAYLNLVLLRVAEGKGPGGSDHQEAALEVMLQVTPPASSSVALCQKLFFFLLISAVFVCASLHMTQ